MILKDHKSNEENPVFGDMRTQQVQRGDFRRIYSGKRYIMDVFVGIVKDVKTYTINYQNRARVVIELQSGKRLAFFVDVDDSIKKDTIIEVVGICLKDKSTGFFRFRCLGGYRRLLTHDEINQLIKGRKFEEIKTCNVPWDIISFVKETEPLSA